MILRGDNTQLTHIFRFILLPNQVECGEEFTQQEARHQNAVCGRSGVLPLLDAALRDQYDHII